MSDQVDWQRVEFPDGDRDPGIRLADFTQLVLDFLDSEALALPAAQRPALVCYLLGARDAAQQQSGNLDVDARQTMPDALAGWLGLANDEAQALGMFCSFVPEPPKQPSPEWVDRMCRARPDSIVEIQTYFAQVEAFLREPASARMYWKHCWGLGLDEFMDWLAAPDGFEPRRVVAAVSGANDV